MSDHLKPCGPPHARLLCPSLSSEVGSDSFLLSWWCYLTISSSTASFSFAFDLSQHQGLFQWVSSSHQVAKVLELQLQHQSFQWIFRIDFLWLLWSPCCPSSALNWLHEQVRHGNFDDTSLDCDLRRCFLSLVPHFCPPPSHSVGETGSLQGVEVAFLPTWDKPLVKFFSRKIRPLLWNSTGHTSKWLFFQSFCQR